MADQRSLDEKVDGEAVQIHEQYDDIMAGGINASGHVQELERNFNLMSIVGLGITSGTTWIPLGGSIVVALSNGGPPGVIYELIAASVFYWLIAASLAELASAVPSAGGVYHWASITSGRYGRAVGFFAGWWNFFGWTFALSAGFQVTSLIVCSMYAIFHSGFVIERWHVLIVYLIELWICFALVVWANRIMPLFEQLGAYLTVIGCFATVVICAALRSKGDAPENATDAFVWRDWKNLTGWKSDGLVFLMGMLNGSFTVGTPDVITHMAEEVPRPSKNLPLAMLWQFIIGFVTAMIYLIAIFYGISDFDAVIESITVYFLPLTEIYLQCAHSAAGAFGLLLLIFVPFCLGMFGLYLNASRIFWTLARDKATPFPSFFGKVNSTTRNPSNAAFFCACFCTVLGFIYLGSQTAFTAFVGSFVVLTSLSYLMAIGPHLISGRKSVQPGWFWMKGSIGFVVNGIACAYIMTFNVIYMFPAVYPVTAAYMNYTVVMAGGLTVFVACFWFWRRKEYEGPPPFQPRENISAKNAL